MQKASKDEKTNPRSKLQVCLLLRNKKTSKKIARILATKEGRKGAKMPNAQKYTSEKAEK